MPASPGGALPAEGGEPGHHHGSAIDDIGDEPSEQRQMEVGPVEHGQRLDKVLVTLVPEFSRSHLQTLVDAGHVRVDGEPVRQPSRKLALGAKLSVDLVPTMESQSFRAERMALPVAHEDDDIIVIDKPVGLVVHPAAGNWSGTLLNGLLHHHAAAAALPRAGIVHRLDKDTSGLMVVGKTLQSVTALTRAMAAREVRRQYLALVHGSPRDKRFRVDEPLGRDPLSRIRMAIVSGGKPSQTDVDVLATLDGVSAVKCTLHTGRTHQIRVHLASKGHPLVGDRTYGGRPWRGIERQALHAAWLSFAHPASGAAMSFSSPVPADLIEAWLAVTGVDSRENP